MIDPKVIEYIKLETTKGVSKDEIIKNLMKGGGWTLADIQAHFLIAEQNQNGVPIKPIQNTQSNTMQTQPKKKINILGLNFFIFVGYYLLAIVSAKIFGKGNFGGIFIFYGYMIHAIILVILSVVQGIRGTYKKVKTGAGQYFLTAILLLIIGFGACTFAITSGIINLNI